MYIDYGEVSDNLVSNIPDYNIGSVVASCFANSESMHNTVQKSLRVSDVYIVKTVTEGGGSIYTQSEIAVRIPTNVISGILNRIKECIAMSNINLREEGVCYALWYTLASGKKVSVTLSDYTSKYESGRFAVNPWDTVFVDSVLIGRDLVYEWNVARLESKDYSSTVEQYYVKKNK